MGRIIRDHWTIENCLHWVLDIVFREDECRIRTDHAPTNFATMRHIACKLLQIARRKEKKLSMRGARKLAAWDDEFLRMIVT
jgi:predicted transposase YbfD/YdcC